MSSDKQAILTRLRKGQQWLIETDAKLWTLPDVGMGSELEHQFLDGLDLWCNLEWELRSKHGHFGCVMADDGNGHCAENAIAVCMACERTEGANAWRELLRKEG